MSTSSQIIQRVENAVYHEPYMIPILFKEGKVKAGFLHSRLKRYVPHRIGIEFECFGDFANQYVQANKLHWQKFKNFEDHFGLIDFDQDSALYRKGYIKKSDYSELDHEEIRVSIRDYRQLNGLYHIMNEMAKYCTISDDCGIHIHVDLTKYPYYDQKEKAVKWFNNHLSEVERIFPPYTGKYNKRICKRGKGSWINLSCKDTVEFRIAPLTFDYEVLITWIVKCSKLVSRMIQECQLAKFDNDSGSRSNYKIIDLNDYDGDPVEQSLSDLTERYFPDEGQNPPEDNDTPEGTPNYYHGPNITEPLDAQDERLAVLTRLSSEPGGLNSNFLNFLGNELSTYGVAWFRNGDRIVMDFPDVTSGWITVEDAISAWVNGGISNVISCAQSNSYTTIWNNVTSAANTYLTNSGIYSAINRYC